MSLVSKEQIEELYIKQGLTKAETAKRLGIGKTTLWNYCKEYGIESTKFWTEKEVDYLEENYGKYSLKVLAKNLNRTESAIKEKCTRLGLTSALRNTGLLTTSELAIAFKTDRKTIWNYIQYKGLPAKKKAVLRNGKFWRIDINEFWKWLKNNKELLDFSKLEKNILGAEPAWVEEKRKTDTRNKSRRNKNWSNFEINYLKANYKIKTFDEIAKDLNRTLASVQVKSRKLGLSKVVEIKWKSVEINLLINMKMQGLTDIEIAEELGRSLSSVDWKRKELLKNGILDYRYRRARGC